jgi:hypothetical protein
MKSKHNLLSLLLTPALLSAAALPSQAEVASLFAEGQSKFNFRLRHEAVDQDGVAEDASATTLRSRFTWNSKAEQTWRLGIEADYVLVVGSEEFNSTENGNTQFPVVADPEGFDLNQAFVKYVGDSVTGTFGRQRIVHDGQRFIGGVAWRQNEQTYDALRLQSSLGSIKVDYSYVWNVNRIFGPDDGVQPADWDGNTHLLHTTLFNSDGHQIKGMAYLLDFQEDNGPVNSTETYGLTYAGSFDKLKLSAAYATQSDYQDSPLDYSADYYEASVSYAFPQFGVKAGIEVLGSDDGVAAFRTPLATLHKFQGWADVFLNTPANGIEDTYLSVSGSISKVKLVLSYHQFDANEGGADYCSELNLVGTYKLAKSWTVQGKFADYDAQDFATDRTKFWLTLSFQP